MSEANEVSERIGWGGMWCVAVRFCGFQFCQECMRIC